MVYLGGGQDWLTHETFARDILINGPLMTLGQDLGEGRAFYAQPLYPYFLAGLHWLFGEDQFGVTAAQVAMLGFTCVIMWELARRLYGRGVAWLTLALVTVFALVQLDWVARRLISESLYFLVLPACLLACVIAHQRGGRLTAVIAGVLMGISVLTRGTTLLLLPIAAVILGRRQGLRSAVLLTVAAVLIFGLAPIRNAIVSGRPAILATSGGVNMEKFHRPSDVVRMARADDNPIYNALGLDKPTREVLEFIVQDPAGYLQACLILAAYTIGFGFALDEAQVQLFPDLIAYSAIYLLTLLLSARARIAEAWCLHAFIAIHFLAMVIFTPYDYENRLVLPMFVPMLCFVALGIMSLASTLARFRAPRPALAAPRMQPEVSDGR
jgi:4-amino-4-deoxy-L-arabinose transferase-like glycosyltransferase